MASQSKNAPASTWMHTCTDGQTARKHDAPSGPYRTTGWVAKHNKNVFFTNSTSQSIIWIHIKEKQTMVADAWPSPWFHSWQLRLQWWTCVDRWQCRMHGTGVRGCPSWLTRRWWRSSGITLHWLWLISSCDDFRSDFTHNWCCLHGCIRCRQNLTRVGTHPDRQNKQNLRVTS